MLENYTCLAKKGRKIFSQKLLWEIVHKSILWEQLFYTSIDCWFLPHFLNMSPPAPHVKASVPSVLSKLVRQQLCVLAKKRFGLSLVPTRNWPEIYEAVKSAAEADQCEVCEKDDGCCNVESHLWDPSALEDPEGEFSGTRERDPSVSTAGIRSLISQQQPPSNPLENRGTPLSSQHQHVSTQPNQVTPTRDDRGRRPSLNASPQTVSSRSQRLLDQDPIYELLEDLSTRHLVAVAMRLGLSTLQGCGRREHIAAIRLKMPENIECEICPGESGSCSADTHKFLTQDIDFWIERGDITSTHGSPEIIHTPATPSFSDQDGLLSRPPTQPCRVFQLSRPQLCALGLTYGLSGDSELYPGSSHALLLSCISTAMTKSRQTCMNCPTGCNTETHIVNPAALDTSSFLNVRFDTSMTCQQQAPPAVSTSVTYTSATLSTSTSTSSASGYQPSPFDFGQFSGVLPSSNPSVMGGTFPYGNPHIPNSFGVAHPRFHSGTSFGSFGVPPSQPWHGFQAQNFPTPPNLTQWYEDQRRLDRESFSRQLKDQQQLFQQHLNNVLDRQPPTPPTTLSRPAPATNAPAIPNVPPLSVPNATPSTPTSASPANPAIFGLNPLPPVDTFTPTGKINTENMMFSGANVGPLLSASDVRESSKRKVLSGEHVSVGEEVKSQLYWPHMLLDSAYSHVKPEFRALTPEQFTAGYAAMMLVYLPEELNDGPIANMLRHLNRIMSYAQVSDWKQLMGFTANFFKACENHSISFGRWAPVQAWHARHLESIRLSGHKKGRSDQTGSTDVDDKKKKIHVTDNFMRAKKLCLAFNRGTCDQTTDHLIGKTTVVHACGLCLFKEKGVVTDHGLKTCSLKKDF